MAPWLWVALSIPLCITIDRFVAGKTPSKSSEPGFIKRRRWYTLLFTAGALALLLNLQLQQRSVEAVDSLSQFIVPLFTLGLFLITLSLVRNRSVPTSNKNDIAAIAASEPISASNGPEPNRKRVSVLLFSLLLAMAAIATAGSEDLTMLPAFISGTLWMGAIGLGFAVGWHKTGWRIPSLKTLLITGALLLFALSIRIIYLNQIPNPMYGDEGSFSFSAVEFITSKHNNLFNTGWFGFPSLYFFLQSIPIRLFGNTVFAPRLWSVLVGSLSVMALYFLGRHMFNQRVGLVGGLLLAANPLHIEFSRIAINNIWDSLSFTLVLGSLWYAWKYNKRNAFLLAGFFFGMSQYFYITGRLLLVFVPIWIFLLSRRGGWQGQQRVNHLVYGACVAVVTALPIAWHYLTHPSEYFQVISRVSIWASSSRLNPGLLWNSLLKGLGAYTYIPLNEYFKAGEPVLRIWPALFFILGLLFLLLHRHNYRLSMLASWLLALSIAAGLSTSPPAAQRLIAATPAASLIAAYGLVATTGYLENQWPQIKRGSLAMVIVLTLWIAADDLRFYFLEHAPQWDNGLTSEVSFRMGLYMQDHPPDSHIVLFTYPLMGYENLLAFKYLAPQVQGINMEDVWGSPVNPIVNGEYLIFVFTSQHEDSLKAVQEDYPQGKLIHETYRNDRTVYWLYEVGSPSQ